MSTALKPIRDCGPEFGRRVERGLRAELRSAEREAARRFSHRMFEIGRDCDRFDRADAIQAECDRLLALSGSTEEDTMSLDCPAPVPVRRFFSAPHPLNEGDMPRAARFAEGTPPAVPSASLRTTVNGLVVDLVAATSISVFLAALLIWSAVLTGRL